MQPCLQNDFSLDTYQLAVTKHIEKAILLRQTFYNNLRGGNVLDDDSCIDNCTDDESDNESDSDQDYNQSQVLCNDRNISTIFDSDIVWQKPILVLGKTGAGKTQALCQAINKHVQFANVLVATPTGFLASHFRAMLPDEVTCETIHYAFHIAVNPEQPPATNWAIAHYDLAVIDEISMISQTNFAHILNIVRPVLVVCGENAQQQPFEKTSKCTITVPCPLNNDTFLSSTYRYTLRGQHRVEDHDYIKFLDHIRHWKPTQQLLDTLQEGRVLCPDAVLRTEKIIQALQSHPDTVLRFTNEAANELNNVITSTLFSNNEPLATFNWAVRWLVPLFSKTCESYHTKQR